MKRLRWVGLGRMIGAGLDRGVRGVVERRQRQDRAREDRGGMDWAGVDLGVWGVAVLSV